MKNAQDDAEILDRIDFFRANQPYDLCDLHRKAYHEKWKQAEMYRVQQAPSCHACKDHSGLYPVYLKRHDSFFKLEPEFNARHIQRQASEQWIAILCYPCIAKYEKYANESVNTWPRRYLAKLTGLVEPCAQLIMDYAPLEYVTPLPCAQCCGFYLPWFHPKPARVPQPIPFRAPKRQKMASKTVLVQVRDGSHCDIYIGRSYPGRTRSYWANPFSAKTYGLETSLVLYEEYVRKLLANDPALLYTQLGPLRHKRLGCSCGLRRCHGEVLIKIINEFWPN